jgi:hypothetical protein
MKCWEVKREDNIKIALGEKGCKWLSIVSMGGEWCCLHPTSYFSAFFGHNNKKVKKK